MKIPLYIERDDETSVLCGGGCPFLITENTYFCMLSREALSVTMDQFKNTYHALRADFCKRIK